MVPYTLILTALLSPSFFGFCCYSDPLFAFVLYFISPQVIRVMEVPVVKIREGETNAEEKMMIKSIVNMVIQYTVPQSSESLCYFKRN